MNKLYILKNMGFRISWKLIAIGVFGNGEILPSITLSDVVDFLDDSLRDINEQTDNIIKLICEKDDSIEFYNILKKLAKEDTADIIIQKRKWRACLLKIMIDNINDDYLQGLLELIEFWVSMGKPNDCPQIFPSKDNKKSVQNYFTQASYELNLNKNKEWLKKEILNIVKLEE